jgi:hypothetical protein
MIINSEFFSFNMWEWFFHSSILEWTESATQVIGWHPIIEAIPSNSNPKMGQKDEIVWSDSLQILGQSSLGAIKNSLCGSRMLFLDIRFFYGWLFNRNSQLKIDFIGLVYMA